MFARDGDAVAFEELRPHIQQAPREILWDIRREDVQEVLGHPKNSAPGPDGLKYKAWAALGEEAIDIFFEVAQSLLGGAEPPAWFNDSFMVFLAKGKESSDSCFTARTPSCTRPLTLADSAQKVIAKLLNRSLAKVAAATVSPLQCGFVRGRRIQDAILMTEAHGIAARIDSPEQGGMIFLDQKAAFPSVARNYLFEVLRAMGVPALFPQAILYLYSNSNAFVRFGGSDKLVVELRQGIKQGCPMSGNL